MNTVLVNTSAITALLVPTDVHHAKARRAFDRLAAGATRLVVTSYTLVECYALIDRLVGRQAVRQFRDEFSPLLEVVWVGLDEHEQGLDIVAEAAASGPTLVDAVSFVVARNLDIEDVFAYDAHFTQAGFTSVG